MWKKKASIKDLLPFPVQSDHAEYSMILSSHDDTKPTKELLQVSIEAIKEAMDVDLSDISQRLSSPPNYPDIWPGEHYKLLAGFIKALKPYKVIEIGTATGLSSLAMQKYLSKDSKLISFDIVPWNEYPNTVLVEKDFTNFSQVVADLVDDISLERYRHQLENADFIFIDAVHDGIFEEALLKQFRKLHFTSSPYLLFDDIRVWKMLKMWRELSLPKLDLTSFGHWSGTGLALWK